MPPDLLIAETCSTVDVQVHGYYMFKDGKEARVAYPVEGISQAHSLLGAEVAGRSFHNGCFVQRLRQAAASCPGISLRQASVRRLLNGARQQFLCFTDQIVHLPDLPDSLPMLQQLACIRAVHQQDPIAWQ